MDELIRAGKAPAENATELSKINEVALSQKCPRKS